MPTDKEVQFYHEMINIYKRALHEAGYKATRFLNMVNEQGGLGAAKTLLHAEKESDGYTALYMRDRLDLTVEALVIKPEWKELFTDDEIGMAIKRLRQFGFKF